MLSLLLATLEMMGLTFAIGFFVAFVIKMIALAADSLDFYSSHQKELLRLRRFKKIRQKMELMMFHEGYPEEDEENLNDQREDFSRGISRNPGDCRGYYHGVSPGVPRSNLFDYYYTEDTHAVFLRNEEAVHRQRKKIRADKSAEKAK